MASVLPEQFSGQVGQTPPASTSPPSRAAWFLFGGVVLGFAGFVAGSLVGYKAREDEEKRAGMYRKMQADLERILGPGDYYSKKQRGL